MNFVIEKYNMDLKHTFAQLGRSEKLVTAKEKYIARKKEFKTVFKTAMRERSWNCPKKGSKKKIDDLRTELLTVRAAGIDMYGSNASLSDPETTVVLQIPSNSLGNPFGKQQKVPLTIVNPVSVASDLTVRKETSDIGPQVGDDNLTPALGDIRLAQAPRVHLRFLILWLRIRTKEIRSRSRQSQSQWRQKGTRARSWHSQSRWRPKRYHPLKSRTGKSQTQILQN